VLAVAGIIVPGAAVRLTGSGLGCAQWPTCNAGEFHPNLEHHALIEFVNRMITGVVSVAVILAVLGSMFLRPRRRDLLWLSWGLVAGVVGQIILGAVVVRGHLSPSTVGAHFLLSIVLLADAVVLHRRAVFEPGERPQPLDARMTTLGSAVLALAAVAVILGTVVTGTGPHGGQSQGEAVRRYGFELVTVTRIHSGAVWALLAATLALAWVAFRVPEAAAARAAVVRLVWARAAQGAVGYAQYASKLPWGLVLVHIVGAVAVWIAALDVALTVWGRPAPRSGLAEQSHWAEVGVARVG
jgi:cytochrome c oxidase assembly protein subunit 15